MGDRYLHICSDLKVYTAFQSVSINDLILLVFLENLKSIIVCNLLIYIISNACV